MSGAKIQRAIHWKRLGVNYSFLVQGADDGRVEEFDNPSLAAKVAASLDRKDTQRRKAIQKILIAAEPYNDGSSNNKDEILTFRLNDVPYFFGVDERGKKVSPLKRESNVVEALLDKKKSGSKLPENVESQVDEASPLSSRKSGR